MRRLISAALVLVTALAALADSPPPPPSTRLFYSPSRKFVALSEPATNTITTYRVGLGGTLSKLWSMQGWEREAWLADDGEHFVASYHGMNLIPWNFERDMTMLRFYQNGKLLKTVGLDEIVQDQTRLQETASHHYWGHFLGRDEKGRIIVYTVEGKELFYDSASGNLMETRAVTESEFLESALMSQAQREHEVTLLRIHPYPGSKRGDYYCSLQLPLGAFVEKTEGEDFDVYEIYSGTGPGVDLGVYVGNHPDFPPKAVDGSEVTDLDICAHDLQPEETVLRMSGGSVSEVKIRSWWKDGKPVHRELLVYIQNPDNIQIPAYVHAWTARSLPEEQRLVVEKILFSLQVRQYPP